MANLRTNNLSGEQGQNAYRGSVFFDGESQLDVTSNSDIAVGTGAYTAELWFHSGLNSGENSLFGTFTASNFGFGMWHNANNLYFEERQNAFSGDNPRIIYDTFEEGHWYHLAMCRDSSSGTLRAYVNGVQIGSTTSNLRTIAGTAPTIGENNAAANQCKGYISNIRFSNTELYPSGTTFTPPTSELTADASTILLACQDSDDPTQEETGKTITAKGSFRLDKGTGNLIVNGLDWDGAGSSYSTTMPTGWTAGNGAQVKYESGGVGGGGADRKIRLRNDGNNSFINQEIPTVIGQRYFYNVHLEAQNSGLGLKINAGTSSGDGTSLADSFNAGTDGTESRRTGFFIATATTTHFSLQIISGTDDASVFWDDVTVTPHNPITPKIIPPYGVDAGNTFGGPIQQSTQGYMYFPTGRTEERGRGRGVIFGGYSSPTGYTQDIYYIDIQSMGNAVHFGDITATRYSGGGCGSSTRGIIGGGRAGSDSNRINIIEYVEIAITSNSLDFGDLTGIKAFNPGGGNQTRGIWMGGSSPTTLDDIEYVTIASKGDAIDFGNLRAASYAPATAASPTRMLAMGGGNPSSFFDYIDFVEIATTGNAQDFGDLTQDRNQNTGVSSNTRAVAMSGARSPALSNVMDFVTIATTGNATDFGDTLSTYEHTGSVNNSIRGVLCGARTPSYINILESITIATTGNSTDFGDIPRDNLAYVVGASDSHGGLS